MNPSAGRNRHVNTAPQGAKPTDKPPYTAKPINRKKLQTNTHTPAGIPRHFLAPNIHLDNKD